MRARAPSGHGGLVFLPGSNAGDLDLAMRASLAESVGYIYSAAKDRLDCTERELEQTLTHIRAHRVKPGVFGRYYELVLALRRQRYDEARVLFREVAVVSQVTPDLEILPFNDQALGADKRLYHALFDRPSSGAQLLAPPSLPQWEAFARRLPAALAVIRRADAALHKELLSLIITIVGAAPPKTASARPFGSASSFMLWGAVIVNVENCPTFAHLLEALVHEAAHQLLFAHSIEEPLVLNATEERYPSPLRSDPRPMDGVFHATFVTARVHYALRRIQLAASADVARLGFPDLEAKLAGLNARFREGHQTVARFGRLTKSGAKIMEEAADYMRAA